jgi:hypothetical protein
MGSGGTSITRRRGANGLARGIARAVIRAGGVLPKQRPDGRPTLHERPSAIDWYTACRVRWNSHCLAGGLASSLNRSRYHPFCAYLYKLRSKVRKSTARCLRSICRCRGLLLRDVVSSYTGAGEGGAAPALRWVRVNCHAIAVTPAQLAVLCRERWQDERLRGETLRSAQLKCFFPAPIIFS